MISREKLDSYISTKTPAFFVVQTAGDEGDWKFITSLEELRRLRLTQVVFAERVTLISDTPEKNTRRFFSTPLGFLKTVIISLLKKTGRFFRSIQRILLMEIKVY